ncbi:helix-turn-helix domain-containing protein [Clostridium frigoris]|uniref:helix-turn-helix domain-containing protein n=1 Tax=Clostridium frigoris TaxID=205327 RepID=UPI001FEB49AD|nr:helix-turn-helix domain-containing protein [Clostridium frigoris]
MIEEIFNRLTWNKRMEVLRIIKGWSHRRAGEECLTNNKNYWLWEKGKSYPRHLSRKSIASAFGVEMEHIFPPTDKVTKNTKNKKKVIVNILCEEE